MFIVVLKRPKGFHLVLLLLLTVTVGAIWIWVWLNQPYLPPRIGLEGLSPALVQQLFPGEQLGEITLRSTRELLTLLNGGKLDYIVEMNEPTPGLDSVLLDQLAPVIVVPFFDPTEHHELKELEVLARSESANVLVADTLALPGFPWSDHEVTYYSSAEIIRQLTEGSAKIGIIPFRDRSPAVRVVPLIDNPNLERSLYLSRRKPSWHEELKKHYTGHKDLMETVMPVADEEVRLLAVGDIMLDRDVKKVGLQKGWESIFAEVAPHLRQADLAFANLESPIGDKGHFINMFQAPPEAVLGLAYAGFDVVSLANNHTLDFHHAGMFETMRLLAEHSIDWVGAGGDIQQARTALIKEVNGVRIGFLAYTEMWFVHAREPISWRATDEEAGVAPAELEMMVEDIRKLRSACDCIVVSMHWGKEYDQHPTAEQKRLARGAVDAGANLVLGHHPHVLQGIEFYKEGVIAYSLGNFVFDLNIANTWESMILEFTLSSTGPKEMTITPAYIFGVQPRILQGAHRNALYRQIRDLSLQITQ
jgi:poly-gamma-glutamate synthesis protein (capsule biosynthesis protein)